MNPKVDQCLWEAGQIETTQDARLAEDTSRLAGWASMMREIAIAQVHVVGACLANDPARWSALDENRHTRACPKIFCEFWGLDNLLSGSGGLHRLSNEFHQGRRAVGVGEFWTFSEFVERIHQEAQLQIARN
jgi:hypothetical protein